jgi:hypothetical protein
VTQRFYKLIVASLSIISTISGFGQERAASIPVITLVTVHHSEISKTRSPAGLNQFSIKQENKFYKKLPVALPCTRLTPVDNDYYVQHFGFFCRQEWKLEKVTKMPFRFRLGSLDYCNTLEQK